MRILGRFVNFGTANESLFDGHTLRSAWREPQARTAARRRRTDRESRQLPLAPESTSAPRSC